MGKGMGFGLIIGGFGGGGGLGGIGEKAIWEMGKQKIMVLENWGIEVLKL